MTQEATGFPRNHASFLQHKFHFGGGEGVHSGDSSANARYLLHGASAVGTGSGFRALV